ncbi:Phospholipase D [Acetobacteraceae bacterium EV16G]|uniref:Phospholipase D n=1 Tax=Sorlinia euscelidii TaxID=3081148 RepID=A0ABU7U3W6_9PROT
MTQILTTPDIGFLTCRFAVTLIVVLHVLRTKHDTSAAVGWIGFCCFMPFTGAVLYTMFGINRVRRLAQRLVLEHRWPGRDRLMEHRHAVEGRFAPLASMLSRLTERPLLGGNMVECLHNGEGIYPQMIAAIDSAQHSVLLCSYIFRADEVGQRFVAALKRAKARGVEVRVLIDGIGSGYIYSGIARALTRAGIRHARFMHSFLPWRMPFINLRNHRKILVTDGAVGFLGGVNIGAENLLTGSSRQRVADTHFALRGPVVQQLTEAFARDWSFTVGEELEGSKYFPEATAEGHVPLRIVTAGPDDDLEKIEYAILQALTLAQHHVRIMTPYFLPGERLTTEICLAALRGVKVDIVIPKRGNHRIIDYARDASLGPYLQAGCAIWLAKPPFNHAKLMVCDSTWCFVGSSNMDLRSLRLNFEINLEAYDTRLAESLAHFIDSHKANRLTSAYLKSIPFLKRVRNAAIRLLTPYL